MYCRHWIGRRQWHPTPVLLPGKSHGRRSLEGCGPWGRGGSDTTKWLHVHFSLSCIGEGIGNPLQCSCLENPRDGGAWWAAVYGVARSRTQLKWLSSSSRHWIKDWSFPFQKWKMTLFEGSNCFFCFLGYPCDWFIISVLFYLNHCSLNSLKNALTLFFKL